MTGFFQESNGTLSSTRLCFVGFTFIVAVSWAFVSWSNKTLADIPWNVVTIIGALGGVKLFQKDKEVDAAS